MNVSKKYKLVQDACMGFHLFVCGCKKEEIRAIGSGKLYKKLALRNVIEHADHGSILDMGSTPF